MSLRGQRTIVPPALGYAVGAEYAGAGTPIVLTPDQTNLVASEDVHIDMQLSCRVVLATPVANALTLPFWRLTWGSNTVVFDAQQGASLTVCARSCTLTPFVKNLGSVLNPLDATFVFSAEGCVGRSLTRASPGFTSQLTLVDLYRLAVPLNTISALRPIPAGAKSHILWASVAATGLSAGYGVGYVQWIGGDNATIVGETLYGEQFFAQPIPNGAIGGYRLRNPTAINQVATVSFDLSY